MQFFYELEPEVPGGWGEQTIADASVHPPIVSKLHLEFAGWLGDAILESFPCYVITSELADELRANNLTGFAWRDVIVSATEEFSELQPDVTLPDFVWLCVNGKPSNEDFGISESNTLIVSSSAYNVLQRFQLNHCDVTKLT